MKVIAILCFVFALTTSIQSREWIVVKTSDKVFNDLLKQYHDRMIVHIEGLCGHESFSILGGCNTCSFTYLHPICACTERYCFRATPSESFLCQVASQKSVMKVLAHSKKIFYTAYIKPTNCNDAPQWIKFKLLSK